MEGREQRCSAPREPSVCQKPNSSLLDEFHVSSASSPFFFFHFRHAITGRRKPAEPKRSEIYFFFFPTSLRSASVFSVRVSCVCLLSLLEARRSARFCSARHKAVAARFCGERVKYDVAALQGHAGRQKRRQKRRDKGEKIISRAESLRSNLVTCERRMRSSILRT